VSNAIFTVGEEQSAYRLALHELGHALGLGTLAGSTDLMDAAGWQQATGISTLDLYALQTISTISVDEGAPSFIALSQNAPYRVVPESL
jgi:homogentisate 1,2-dioxygenase